MEAVTLKIALIGLGKMGSNLALNLKDHGYEVIGYDVNKRICEILCQQGIHIEENLDDLLRVLGERKIVWLMLPSGKCTEQMVVKLMEKLRHGDILMEAGNSNYKDTMRIAKEVEKLGIHYLDVGTSGGIDGARHGACLMIGGNREAYDYMEHVFQDIAVQHGCLYTGKSGSGHFMKMVHNGIEYGMMQAIGEGFQIMKESDFNYNLEKVAENWNHGSVIRGWLMEIAQSKFFDHPDLETFQGRVDASGEAKWTVETAMQMEIPTPIIALSLMMRHYSKEDDNFSCKVVAALRNGFGGHEYKETKDT